MAEERTINEKSARGIKPKISSGGPILKFIGPEGASKVVLLIAALSIILQGNEAFWTYGINATPVNRLGIFCGIILYILGIILILMIGTIGFGTATLKKIELIEKYYNPFVLLCMAILIIVFEILSATASFLVLQSENILTLVFSSLLGGTLTIIAAILEQTKYKEIMKPSKLLGLVGAFFAIIEAFILFITLPILLSRYWDGIIAIVVVNLLLLSIYDKIRFIPYEWWMVLILGFILYGWVPGIGGTLVLISFILMLIEK